MTRYSEFCGLRAQTGNYPQLLLGRAPRRSPLFSRNRIGSGVKIIATFGKFCRRANGRLFWADGRIWPSNAINALHVEVQTGKTERKTEKNSAFSWMASVGHEGHFMKAKKLPRMSLIYSDLLEWSAVTARVSRDQILSAEWSPTCLN